MIFFVTGLVAFLAALLTLFSGFGLGTLMTPVFGLFFPIEMAVALTGIVHLLNNLFKLSLVGRHASWPVVRRFGIPSVLGGFVGAWALTQLAGEGILFRWHWAERTMEISVLKLVIAVLMIFFAAMELFPALKNWRVGSRFLALGGVLSGFFGGLSGNQGALRSAFLINSGLGKEQFIATGVVIACLVDMTRLPVYASRFSGEAVWAQWPLLLSTTLCAFAGAFIGARYLKKVTYAAVQWITAVFIMAVALLLGAGIL